jgi:hypothetical protein
MEQPKAFFAVRHIGPPTPLPCPQCGTPTLVMYKDRTCGSCKFFAQTTLTRGPSMTTDTAQGE